MNAILEAKSISKIYDEGKIKTEVLLGLDLTIQASVLLSLVAAVLAKVRFCICWAGLIRQLQVKFG